MISLLWASPGPVRSVTAYAGLADITHLVLRHENGGTSMVTVTLSAPMSAEFTELYLWGQVAMTLT